MTWIRSRRLELVTLGKRTSTEDLACFLDPPELFELN